MTRKRSGRSGKSSPVTIRWSVADLTITGPKDQERDLRDALERKLRTALAAACPWFAQSGFAARTAFKIAYSARFGVLDAVHVIVAKLKVDYKNRGAWKKWIRIDEASADRRRALRSAPVSTFAKLTEKDGLSRGAANAVMRDRTAKARAKAECAKKKK